MTVSNSEKDFGFPIIKKQKIEINDLKLIAFNDTRKVDSGINQKKAVHFFIDDYRMDGVYQHPDRYLDRLSQYRYLITPDFSVYSNMKRWRQIESIAHTRWVGAYWQSQGLKVIPSVTWGNSNTFDFCFKGIESGSVVAIGMIGCKSDKKAFMSGYQEMLKQINPTEILCFGEPFEEMTGSITKFDYMRTRLGARDGRQR